MKTWLEKYFDDDVATNDKEEIINMIDDFAGLFFILKKKQEKKINKPINRNCNQGKSNELLYRSEKNFSQKGLFFFSKKILFLFLFLFLRTKKKKILQ